MTGSDQTHDLLSDILSLSPPVPPPSFPTPSSNIDRDRSLECLLLIRDDGVQQLFIHQPAGAGREPGEDVHGGGSVGVEDTSISYF